MHCRNVGDKTDNNLKSLGFNCWDDCLNNRHDLPFKNDRLEKFLDDLKRSKDALLNNDIDYFVKNLPIKEHYRILAKYFDKATFFDIETTGITHSGNLITVIAAYHNDNLYSFVYPENLEGFLDLAAESKLLVSFNGNSFDMPFILRKFNIPDINCPHIDLRWICYHAGYKTGLKNIEKMLGIKRPADLIDTDGYEAVLLYYRWQAGNQEARQKLIRYCKADALSTYFTAGKILKKYGIDIEINEDLFVKLD